MKKYVILLIATVITFASCKKDNYDVAKQNIKDDAIIRAYLKANNITAQKDTASGLYYKIITQGDNTNVKPGNSVFITYVGKRLADGSIYEQGDDQQFLFPGDFMTAWLVGVPLIGKGGEIILYSPSILAYGNNTVGFVKPNTVLIFDLKVIKFF